MRVFMNPHDYQLMLDVSDSRRAKLAMMLMGRCGYRVGELPQLVYGDLRQSTHPDVDLWFWPVYGKDSKARDTEGKRREAWIPDDVKEAVDEYAEIEGIRDDDHVFRCRKRTIRRDVERTRENAVVKTGNSDYGYISPHDFRAFFATNMTLRKGVDPEIVMELGGWDDRKTFRTHYLDAKFDDIIHMKLAEAGLVEAEGDVPMTEYQMLRMEVRELKDMIEDIELTFNIDGSDEFDDMSLDEYL